jgi:hypothetical protein
MEKLLSLPTSVLVAIGLLAVVQLSLQVWSVLDLIRRPMPSSGASWLWGLVIVVGGFVGALAYLAIGRRMVPDSAADAPVGEGRAAARERAIDRLYGDGDR